MEKTQVEVIRTGTRPDYMMLARALLPRVREFYQDAEAEKKFQEWKRAREEAERR